MANTERLNEFGFESLIEVQRYKGRDRIRPPRNTISQNMNFGARTVNFATTVERWFEVDRTFGPVADVVFSLGQPGNSYVTNQMFNAASALEGMHRRLHPELDKATPDQKDVTKWIVQGLPEVLQPSVKAALSHMYQPSYRQRVEALVGHAGPAFAPYDGSLPKWLKFVTEHRNILAHSLEGLEQEVVTLLRVYQTLDLLPRLILMRELGFTQDEVAKIVSSSRRWQFLRQVLPGDVPDIFGPAVADVS